MMATNPRRLDAENPWPGLDSFGEDDSAYFHGRDTETADLLRLIKRELLTVLFGRSGLGKTSLLRAGLFPILRREGFVPVYIRLDFSGNGPSLRSQILTALLEECEARKIEAPRPKEAETLWEFFHRRDLEFWNEKNRMATPLIVLDQFEEAFTVGHENESARKLAREFLPELGDLIENRIPKPLKAALDENPEMDLGLNYRKSDYKLILSFREDYLAPIEELKAQIPSLAYNRYRLLPMNGLQANDVILVSGSHLVDEGVAADIIGIAAGARRDGKPPGQEELGVLEIDPALLSVICSELNLRRQASGHARITRDLIQGAEHLILSDFYERSLDGLDARIRVFVEDELLTDKGYRDSYAYDDALGLPGITHKALEALVAGRLLRVDDRFGVRRLELTHDVLTQVVKESRDSRKAREAEAAALAREREAALRQRRNRIVSLMLAIGIVMVIGAGGLVAALWRQVDALQLQTMQRAKSLLLSQARWFESSQYDLSLLLNVEAFRLAEQSPALSTLDIKAEFAEKILHHPHLDGFLNDRDKLMDVAFSPDGTLLASAGVDNTITLWDAKTRSSIAVLEGHKDAVLAIAFSPDGKTLASAGKDMVVILWDMETRKPLFAPLKGHADRVMGVAFSPDGKTIASAGYDGQILLWNAETGDKRASFPGNGAQYLGIAYSPTEKLLALACNDKTVVLLDSETGESRATLHGHEDRVLKVVFSPNGSTLASASEDRSIILWDVASTRPLGEPLKKHEGAVWGLSFSPDGMMLASAGEDKTAIVWVLSSPYQPEVLDSISLEGHRGPVRAIDFNRDGKTLASAGDDERVILWNLAKNELLTRYDTHQGPIWSIAFSPDGKLLASASEKKQVTLWDLAQGKALFSMPGQHKAPVMAVAFSPDGKWLASASEDKMVVLWELSKGPVTGITLQGHADSVQGVVFSPDGKLLASAGLDGNVILWDMQKQSALATLTGNQSAARSMAFSPDGSLLAVGGDDNTVYLWDVAKRRRKAALAGHQQRIYAVAFSPDSRLLASASQDGAIVLWDTAGYKLLDTLRGQPVRAMAFSPDGQALATAVQDGSLTLWNLAARKPLVSLQGHRGRALSVAFSPDGQAMASSGVDETILVWDWNLKSMARLACRIANRNLSESEWSDYLGDLPFRKTCE